MDTRNIVERCRVAIRLQQAFQTKHCDKLADAFERIHVKAYLDRCELESEVFDAMNDQALGELEGRILSFKKHLSFPPSDRLSPYQLSVGLDYSLNEAFTVSIIEGSLSRHCVRVEGYTHDMDIRYDQPLGTRRFTDVHAGIVAAASFVILTHLGAQKPLNRAVDVLVEAGSYAFAGSSKLLLDMVRRHEMFDAKNFGFDDDNWNFIKALASETQIKSNIAPLCVGVAVFSFVAALWLIEADEELAIRNKKIEEIKNDRF